MSPSAEQPGASKGGLESVHQVDIYALGTEWGFKNFFGGPDSLRLIGAEAGVVPGDVENAAIIADRYWEDPKQLELYISRVHAAALHENDGYIEARRHPLTGLPNRRAFAEELTGLLWRVLPGDEVVVMLMDVDGFKGVNDMLGHEAGDDLLINVGNGFRRALRAEAPADLLMHVQPLDAGDSEVMLCHQGGDEFGAVAYFPAQRPLPAEAVRPESAGGERRGQRLYSFDERLATVLGRIADSGTASLLEAQKKPGGEKLTGLGLSIGLARYKPGMTVKELLHEADMSMFAAKQQARDRMFGQMEDERRALLVAGAVALRSADFDPGRLADMVLGPRQPGPENELSEEQRLLLFRGAHYLLELADSYRKPTV